MGANNPNDQREQGKSKKIHNIQFGKTGQSEMNREQ
jgi:hypothetical protein